ncbi:hypothetical protein BRADI_4g25855v3 [Brachypodium distachyon]|uniref:Uncharacterized protein n=1 Tax=Brachypodium distachyon TaxID=15368 RepID=A0A0Q3H7S7_BRADI|nr:hypothetical protein BRADI_4g25855v3 [Brachypodium distachyon]
MSIPLAPVFQNPRPCWHKRAGRQRPMSGSKHKIRRLSLYIAMVLKTVMADAMNKTHGWGALRCLEH